ncbi:MAG: pilus assembly protein [Rhodobacteraceae bacterium]|nr:MAG: pilus assembly protein [Paracoccaceae bacterium]
MIRKVSRHLRRFSRREDGSATVEFSILFLPMFTFLLSAVEIGMIHIHHSMLERAVDMTVRDIRLGTGTAPQHDQIRQTICDRAGFIDDCSGSVRIEMVLMDPFNWTNPPTDADCIDQSQTIAPVRSFTNGASNQLMFMRVCATFDPVFPTIGMGKNLIKDGAGKYALISTAAFVQEPG